MPRPMSIAARRGGLLTPTAEPRTDATGRGRGPRCEPSKIGAVAGARCAAQSLSHRKAKQRTIYRWEHEAVIERHRARMAEAAAAYDAPPRRTRRASVRHAEMPCRLPPLPAARLRQGARRVEPDGAVLQLHPRAEHHRLRQVHRLHGGKDAFNVRARSDSRSATHSARSEGNTNHLMVRNQPPRSSYSLLKGFLLSLAGHSLHIPSPSGA